MRPLVTARNPFTDRLRAPDRPTVQLPVLYGCQNSTRATSSGPSLLRVPRLQPGPGTSLSHLAGSYVISRACLTLSLSVREEYYTQPPPNVYPSDHRFTRWADQGFQAARPQRPHQLSAVPHRDSSRAGPRRSPRELRDRVWGCRTARHVSTPVRPGTSSTPDGPPFRIDYRPTRHDPRSARILSRCGVVCPRARRMSTRRRHRSHVSGARRHHCHTHSCESVIKTVISCR